MKDWRRKKKIIYVLERMIEKENIEKVNESIGKIVDIWEGLEMWRRNDGGWFINSNEERILNVEEIRKIGEGLKDE